jgi:signal transduction histidine kinase
VFQNRLVHTSSFRLTALYAGLFMICALVLYGVTYWFATDYAARDEINEIAEEFAAIQDDLDLVGETQLPLIIQNHLRERRDVRAVYLLEDKEGNKIAGNMDAMPPVLGPTMLRLPMDGSMRDVRAEGYTLSNGDYVLVGQDTSVLREMKLVIARAFGVGLLITLALAVIGSAAISTATLKRVEAVSKTARAIIGGDLSQRVPLRGVTDEFDDLAGSVNAMLDRIEDLMRSMRQVSTDIAHDLRTPLTRLRQKLEILGRRGNSDDLLHRELSGCLAQLDSILETFGALLRIAQIEAGSNTTPKTPIDITQLLGGIVDDFVPAAEDHGHRLSAKLEKDLRVNGDRELITQMIVNLVDNAIRHSPTGADISVQARADGASVELAVTDTGPGIPPEERENVLRPFHRLEASRTTEGSGLGLSLVAAIAKRHEAVLNLADNAPGLRVSVVLPLAV